MLILLRSTFCVFHSFQTTTKNSLIRIANLNSFRFEWSSFAEALPNCLTLVWIQVEWFNLNLDYPLTSFSSIIYTIHWFRVEKFYWMLFKRFSIMSKEDIRNIQYQLVECTSFGSRWRNCNANSAVIWIPYFEAMTC